MGGGLLSSYRKDLVTLKRESIFPIEEKSFYRTAAGMKSVEKRPAAGGESCKIKIGMHRDNITPAFNRWSNIFFTMEKS